MGIELVEKNSDVIEIQLFAHHHTDSFKIFTGAASGSPIALGLVAPGLTPWNSTLAPETGANNPGLRLFEFNKTTGQIVDYHQFFLNLTKANEVNVAEWELEYSLLQYYNLSDMSVTSISSLLEEVKNLLYKHFCYTGCSVKMCCFLQCTA